MGCGSSAWAYTLTEEEADKAAATRCLGGDIRFAAREGNIAAVRHFLRVDPESLDRDDHGLGYTPLVFAVRQGRVEVAKLLLTSGASVEVKSDEGRTPLHWAAELGNVRLVELLLTFGASMQVKSDAGNTALYWAATNDRAAVVEKLISAGADLEVVNKEGDTPLHVVAGRGYIQVVELLLKARASVEAKDYGGSTALYWAAKNNCAAVVEKLISAGADLEVVNKEGNTALHWAARNGHAGVVKKLISAGASLEVVNKEGNTPLHWAAVNDHAAVVELLISAGGTLDAANKYGWTALHVAATKKNVAVVEQLISLGAKLDVADECGRMPYDLAKEKYGSTKLMGLLYPVLVALLSGRSCRCTKLTESAWRGSPTVRELKEEAEKKLGVKIKHIIGQNHEPLDESKTLAEAGVLPGNTLTAVIAAPEAEYEEGPAETEAEPLDEAQGLKDPRSFIDFLTSADIRLVRLEFLLELHQDGLAMPRRQEAETMSTKSGATALVTLEEYQKLLVNDNTGHVSIRAGPKHQLVTVHFRSVSHMWESMQHPDPWRYQLGLVAQLYQDLQDVVWVFVDFISLHQYKRNDSEESSFRKALERMHMLYSHEVVQVDILEDLTPKERKAKGTLFVYDPAEDRMKWVPITSLKLNPTPHALRGWCQAEKEWARLRMMLCRAMGIPTPPEIFRQRMGQMKFTHRNDAEQVFQLQAKVFREKISGTTHLHLEQLSVQDLEALHEALPYYQKLQFVVVNGISLPGRDAVALVQSGAHDVQMESCNLEDEGAILIADALMKDTTDRLRVLSLTGNGISEKGRSALHKVMEQRPDLKISM